MKDFKPSPMNRGKASVVRQLVPVEYNRLTLSETVSIDEPAGGYMETLEYRNSAREHLMALANGRQECHGKLSGDNDARHHPQAESIRDASVVCNAGRNDRAVNEPSMESCSITVL